MNKEKLKRFVKLNWWKLILSVMVVWLSYLGIASWWVLLAKTVMIPWIQNSAEIIGEFSKWQIIGMMATLQWISLLVIFGTTWVFLKVLFRIIGGFKE